MNSLTLRDFLKRFEQHHWKGSSRDARRGYRNAVTRFAVFLRREPILDDLSANALTDLNRWLQMEVAKSTRKATIGKLRTVWRAAVADGLISCPPPVISQSQSGVPKAPLDGIEAKLIRPFSVAELNTVHNPGAPPATLREFVPQYAAERGLRKRTISSIYQRLTIFEKFLGRPATFVDLSDSMMNLWTARMFEAGLGPVTIRGYRGMALALWRAAYELHYLETRPGRIRKIRIKPAAPQCWTSNQLVEVVDAFRHLRGELASAPTVRRSTFWTAFVLVGYYSALRFGDLMSLRWDQIQDGIIVLPMSKTGDIIACKLPPDAVQVVEKLRGSNRTLVFGQLMNDKNSREFFRRVLRVHGLPGSIKCYGGPPPHYSNAHTPERQRPTSDIAPMAWHTNTMSIQGCYRITNQFRRLSRSSRRRERHCGN